MMILHVNWVDGKIVAWGEMPPAIDASGTPRVSAGRSPYSAPGSELAKLAELFGGKASPARLRASQVKIVSALLPTSGEYPMPSRTFLRPDCWGFDASSPVEFKKWKISALQLSFHEMMAIFSSCSHRDRGDAIAPQVVAGEDLLAVALVWRYAGAVVARQTFLPSVTGAYGRWLPVLDGTDKPRLAAIAGRLPGSFACVDGAVGGIGAVEEMLAAFVDLIVRYAVTTPIFRAQAANGKFTDVHSAWLASLRSYDAKINWKNADEIAEFAKTLDEWRRPVVHAGHEKLKLGFRLLDPTRPESPQPKWKLEPVLTGEGEAQPLSRQLFTKLPSHVRRSVLISLGQATVLCPALKDGIDALGGVVSLSVFDANIFLRQSVPLLRAAGFGVFIPRWCEAGVSSGIVNQSDLRLKATDLNIMAGGAFSLDSLVDVRWQMVLGDATLTQSDVKDILSSGKPLVYWNGRWVFADKEKFGEIQERFKELDGKQTTARELMHLAMNSEAMGLRSVSIDVSEVASRGEFGKVLGKLGDKRHLEDVPVPAGLRGTLRPYQGRGFSWMSFLNDWGFGACLADDMGLGKTIEAITLFLHVRERGDKRPVLVVCPMSIMIKWSRELARFAPGLDTWIYHGPNRPKSEAFVTEASRHDVVITSYQLLCSDLQSINRMKWSVAAIDEAQNIKNPQTRKSKAARSLSASWRLAMTGTPVENHVGDLWAIMEYLNPGLLLPRTKFTEVFQRPIQTGANPDAAKILKRLTGPFILRRLKTDPEISQGLPDKVEQKVYCTLSEEQAKLYAMELAAMKNTLPVEQGIARRGAVLGLITRLKQLCNHPVHYNSAAGLPLRGKGADVASDPLSVSESGKLARFDALLDEVLASGECSLVFTQYAKMGELLKQHLQARLGIEIPFLHGGVPVNRRDEMVAHFQDPDGPPVFILSIKAGGTGLDLTRANHVFHFDRWWNPAVENQATDRAHRIGQKKTVFIHTLICEGTLESHIDDLITGKTELAEELIGSGENWLAGLSDEKLRNVLSLSSTAIVGNQPKLEDDL